MKYISMITTTALLAVIGFATSCVATSSFGERMDPTQFVHLLNEAGVEPAERGPSDMNRPPAEAPAPVAGSQVQRLLEESELILQGIAAEAGPEREQLQNASTRALDVIRSHIDRLPRRLPIDPLVPEAAESTPNAPGSLLQPAFTGLGLEANGDAPAMLRPDSLRVVPIGLDDPVPRRASPDSTPGQALRQLIANLREVAVSAETRAGELERLSGTVGGLTQ